MHHGTVLRSLTNETKFGAVHLKAQYYMMTGYLFPVGLKAPSIGAAVARTLGPRAENVPPYIYIGRDIDTSDTEKQFISEYIGPGFYGVKYAPFMIPDPTAGLATLSAAAGMSRERLDRRHEVSEFARSACRPSRCAMRPRPQDYLKIMESARAMMDSPVKRAFDYAKEEKPATLAAYEPQIARGDVLDKSYYFGKRFGHGLLLARRLVEAGARFVQVEYQYGPFKGFDMHEDGQSRMIEMKRQIDGPIAQLIRDLAERGLLERTLVVVATRVWPHDRQSAQGRRRADRLCRSPVGRKPDDRRQEDVRLPRPFFQRATRCCSSAAASSRASSMAARPIGIRCCRSKTPWR